MTDILIIVGALAFCGVALVLSLVGIWDTLKGIRDDFRNDPS
jgi:hypothetical protein